MAHRAEDDQKVLYTAVLPVTKNPQNHHHHHHHYHHNHNHNNYQNQQQSQVQHRIARVDNPTERSRALYVEFENAFRDTSSDDDQFGFQSWHLSDKPANLHLQSIETISEVQNTNFSLHTRHHTSRDTSHSSTPTSFSPYPFQVVQTASSQNRFYQPQEFSNIHAINSSLSTKATAIPLNSEGISSKTKITEPVANNLTLPQYFLVKYLGRAPCAQIWGTNAVRGPIDEMVQNARQLSSMSELPTLEACVNKMGLTLTRRQSPTRHKSQHRHHSSSPERPHTGQIPLDNISYAMHDVKFSKVASCIVLRHVKSSSTDQKHRLKSNETITECYVFLFQSKDHAHHFAMALAQAFNTEKQQTRVPHSNPADKKEVTRTELHRSKQRHEKQRIDQKQSDRSHVRDSYV